MTRPLLTANKKTNLEDCFFGDSPLFYAGKEIWAEFDALVCRAVLVETIPAHQCVSCRLQLKLHFFWMTIIFLGEGPSPQKKSGRAQVCWKCLNEHNRTFKDLKIRLALFQGGK